MSRREYVDSYSVRPADPHDRREYPDAYQVMGPHSLIGVWEFQHQAEEVAASLNRWSAGQIR